MKTKYFLRTMGLVILMASPLLFSSCSKKADGNLTKEQLIQKDSSLTTSKIDVKNFTESDTDLTTVDYKEFYDQLAPHGQWIQVRAEDIGMKPKIASSKSSVNSNFSLLNLLGIKDAQAETDVDLGMFFVWQPAPDLTVTVGEGETHDYRPYRHGQWVNTDDGWYFRAPTPWEETVHHHGRWVHSQDSGWLWIPGRVWSPAWVDWRQNDDYESWAPLPPSDYIVDGNMSDPNIDDNDYCIVDRHHFLDPDVYKYDNRYYDNGDRISVREMNETMGITVVNNTIMDRGPDVNVIQNFYGGRHIDMINIQHVRNLNDVRYSDKEYNVYTPDFNRYNHRQNTNVSVNQPASYKNYNESRKVNYNNYNSNQNIGSNNNTTQKSNDNGFKPNNNDQVNKQNVNNKVNWSNINTKVNKPNVNTKVNNSNVNNKVNTPNNNIKLNKPNTNTKVNKPNTNTKINKPSTNTKVNKPNTKVNKGV